MLLDVSASMQALEGDPDDEAERESRHDRMLREARELVEGRSYEDEMMIATVSDRVDVLAGLQPQHAPPAGRPRGRAPDLPLARRLRRRCASPRRSPRTASTRS